MEEAWPVAGVPAPVSGAGTIRERIAWILRERVLTGVLAPGSRIDLDAVASEFETSRTPVREACLELTHDGLIRIAPRSGIVVLGVPPETILENFAVMAALAGVAADWAAQRISGGELARVRELKVEVSVAVRSGDDATTPNWMFHREVNKACKSPRLLSMLGMAGRMIPAGFLRAFPEHTPCSLEEHDALVHALAEGDGAAAREITEKHLQGAARVLSARVASMDATMRGNE
ncbi:GntR family transcriptional regulator [Nocardia sp. NPDC055029]